MSDTKNILTFKNIYIYISLFIAFLALIYIFEVFKLFVIAFIIAYLTNPIKLYFDKYLNKTFSSFVSIILFVLAFLSTLILILPIIIEQIQNLILVLPTYLSEVQTLIKELNNKFLFSDKIKSIDISLLFKPLSNSFLSSGTDLINSSIEFFNSFFNMILILVISFYMSLEFNKIKSFFYDLAEKSRFEDFQKLIKEIDQVLSNFLRGQGLICMVLSIFYATSLFFVGIKFGILLGIFSGIISFIPYVGAFLGGGLTLILGFFQFGLSTEMLILLFIFLTGQLLESYYLTPKFVGDAINLNPLWIIFALLTGAYLSGFVGVLISLPTAAIFGVLIRHYFIKLF